MSNHKMDDKNHLEGFLKKWINYYKQYQRRWFIYDRGRLRYYRDQNEVGQVTRSEIYLRGCRINVLKNLGFCIIKDEQTLFTLYAESVRDFEEWIMTLRRGIIRSNLGQFEKQDADAAADCPPPPPITPPDSFEQNNQTNFDWLQIISKHLKSVSEELQGTCVRIDGVCDQLLQEATGELSALDTLSNSVCEFKLQNSRLLELVELMCVTAKNVSDDAADNRASKYINISQQLDHFHTSCENSNIIMEQNKNIPDSSDEEAFFDADETRSTASSANEPIGLQIESEPELTVQPLQHVCSVSDMVLTNVIPNGLHRKSIPERPKVKLSLWSLISNMIGKDLTKVPLPVHFNEPLSMLQRVTESLEYSFLLDKAVSCQNAQFQLCYVLAFAISSYSSTAYRTGKPFNPLLGETYELDRRSDLGWRCVCEQVSHHPPVCALHVEGNGWVLWETYNVKSKFLAKYLEIHPLGLSQLVFTHSGYHISWNRVGTTVNNIVIGTLWIDQFGKMTAKNRTTGDVGVVDFLPYSIFRSNDHKKVFGYVKDNNGENKYAVTGRWDKFVECSKLIRNSTSMKEKVLNRIVLWTANKLPPDAHKMYNFSEFTCSLNEPCEGVAKTDSRLRPDQRTMEEGDFETANELKSKLEDNQRQRGRNLLSKAMEQGKADKHTTVEDLHTPLWFREDTNIEHEGSKIYTYKGGYWEAKAKKDFSNSPDIFIL